MNSKTLATLALLVVAAAAAAEAFGGFGWNDPWMARPRRAAYRDPYAAGPYAYGRRRQPRAPACEVLTAPLRAARFDVREDAARGGHTVEARLPGARAPTVSVPRPGVLEVRAERPVPAHCRGYASSDAVVKQFRVPDGLATSDLDARYSARDGVLRVHVPEPGPPRHCLNVHRPLAREVRPRVEAPRGGGAGANLWAQLPAGVSARDVRVTVPRRDTLELRVQRPVPAGCGDGDDTYTGLWRVPGLEADRDIETATLDARGLLTVRARPAPRPAAAPVEEIRARDREPRKAAAAATGKGPAKEKEAPRVSLREIKRAVAELASEYLAAERGGETAAAPPAPRADADIVDDDGAPRWYHTPLEGCGDREPEADEADELLWIEW